MKIKPQGSNILIEVEERQAKGGIIVASDNSIITEIATVKAIGPDVREVQVGDKVMFKSWNLDITEIDDQKYPFLEEKAILAIIK